MPGPRGDAELLLAELLGCSPNDLRLRRRDALDEPLAARFAEWVARRARREPLQHITGAQEFYGRAFRVDRRALIPRPETEGLVRAALSLDLPPAARAADLGTGSGCIAVSLALERPAWRIHGIERSVPALALAGENAERLGVAGRVELVEGDLARPPAAWTGRMDLVVANPPYVSESEWAALEPEVRDHDPREALVAGESGLEAYAALAPAALRLLRPEGRLVLELGFGQAAAVERILAGAGLATLEIRPDFQAIPRVLVARRAEPA